MIRKKARDAIEGLKGRGIIQCDEEDGMIVEEKERMQLAKCLVDFLKDTIICDDAFRN